MEKMVYVIAGIFLIALIITAGIFLSLDKNSGAVSSGSFIAERPLKSPESAQPNIAEKILKIVFNVF